MELGPYADRLRQLLLADVSTPKPEIAVVISLFQPRDYDKIMFPPVRTRFGEVNVFQFYLHPWKLILKLDKQSFKHPFDKLALSTGSQVLALVQDFLSRGEIAALSRLKRQLTKK